MQNSSEATTTTGTERNSSRSATGRSTRNDAFRILDNMHDYHERAVRDIIDSYQDNIRRMEDEIRAKNRPQKHLEKKLQDYATSTSELRNALAAKKLELQKEKQGGMELLKAKERLEAASEDQFLQIGDLEAKVEAQTTTIVDLEIVSKHKSSAISSLESQVGEKQDIILDLEMVSKDRLSKIGELESKVAAQKEAIMDMEMAGKAFGRKYAKLESLQEKTLKRAEWQAGELKEMHEKLEGLMSLSRRTMVLPEVQRNDGPVSQGNGNAYQPIILDQDDDDVDLATENNSTAAEAYGPARPTAATPPPFSPPSTRAAKLLSLLKETKPSVPASGSQSSTLSELSVPQRSNNRKRKGDGKAIPFAKPPKRSCRRR
ncbi:hypothetical protein QFC22_000958 [Naganishia vaughanmartiniae]|uniref:Uncharacterized protein n=1 Tax=Naganishia vaughanmartiniae TaxID=1424756 RepID=A0ACC2XKI6_9TREE|nr:hypothetical protein QFC22_000958 [Naganishia vaughanmartiniae]